MKCDRSLPPYSLTNPTLGRIEANKPKRMYQCVLRLFYLPPRYLQAPAAVGLKTSSD
ncbi:hypothetical protein [Rubripirellula obstinata]|uniref:hypothetical protein n=1 Tax=Rubripirellula obstinata TaxID=406547 RepID=UPI0012FC2DF4|nr:hypothetical protein [Rubripirellula obstinata]